jgi:ribonuclease P protein component
MGEATVPAEQSAPGQAARVPASHVDARRPGDPQGPPGQGTHPPVGLTGRVWRVRDRATFAALRRGRRGHAGLLTVTWVPAPAGPPRVAFAIGRKVGSAVRRNQLRRRLRALARSSTLPAGAWLVSAAPGAAETGFDTLAGWWQEAVAGLRAP